METDRKRLLYRSTLAPEASLNDVVAITRISRQLNRDAQIHGLLIFDGLQFAQWLEGRAAALDALAARLQRDRRHVDIELLHFAPLDVPGPFIDWALGYHYLGDEAEGSGLDSLRGLRGDAACDAFLRLARSVDTGTAAVAEAA